METSPDLFAALDLVVFRRRSDGTFAGEGQAPEWFQRLTGDQTFPFLGSFLETANAFWARSQGGAVRSGICTETGADGREFHYEVIAVTAGADQYLLFELQPDVEATRAMLQTARETTLDRDRVAGKLDRLRMHLASALDQLDAAGRDIGDATAQLRETPLTAPQQPLADRIQQSVALLGREIATMRQTLVPRAKS